MDRTFFKHTLPVPGGGEETLDIRISENLEFCVRVREIYSKASTWMSLGQTRRMVDALNKEVSAAELREACS